MEKELITTKIAALQIESVEAILTTDTEKLNLNGTFGKLGSKYSMFYTPDGLIQVTITGQLALLMLIEALEDAGIHVVSANTDGIVIYTARSNDWLTQSIIAWWEGVTGFTMETTEFKMLAARDVNSYIGIEVGGAVKAKGAFAPVKPGASGWPNPTGQVCVDAVVAYLKAGTPLRDTIMACTDVRQFVYVRSVTGGASFAPEGTIPELKRAETKWGWNIPRKRVIAAISNGREDEEFCDADLIGRYQQRYDHLVSTREYLGKVVRWIYSTGSQSCILTPAGNLVPRTQGCRPLMELPDALPDDIDYEWYITEAESFLDDIGYNDASVNN